MTPTDIVQLFANRLRRVRDSCHQRSAGCTTAAPTRTRNVAPTAAKGRCGGTEAIQYSNTGAAAPVISIVFLPR